MANGVLGKAPSGVIAIALCVVLISSGCIGCTGEACINRVTFVSRTAAFVGPGPRRHRRSVSRQVL